MQKTLIPFIFLLSFIIQAQNFKKLTPTPPMGWNSWNYFGKKNINENLIKACIDSIHTKGLKKYGYNYIIIDGGWRDNHLNSNGTLRPHPKKFPNGIKTLVDYAHAKGLKFGLHTVPGSHDCAGDKVGSFGIEETHIDQFIKWGVDFIKLDRCKLTLKTCEKSCWNEQNIYNTYKRWRSILDKKNSSILLSISAYKFRDWNNKLSNIARTTGDISCKVTKGAYFSDAQKNNRGKHTHSVLSIAYKNNKSATYAKDGYWNDPDMLVTGKQGLTFEEQQSHFAMWCIMSSPLILGNDPRNISSKEADIILNKTAIQINQTPTEQGIKISNIKGIDIWKKKLTNNEFALLFVNTTMSPIKNFKIDLTTLDISKTSKILDVFKQTHIKYFQKLSFTTHACKFLLIKP